jgi:4-amino-4-deoxy-L-arabinose transferase-like glycosyltransferase
VTTAAPDPAPRRIIRPVWFHAAALVILIVSFVLMLVRYKDDSPAEDEWAHMTRGVSYWQQSDMRLFYSHPPLGNAVTGLVLTLTDDNPDLSRTENWKRANVGGVAFDVMQADYSHERERLFRTRIATMLLGVLLAAYVYWFCFGFFGPVTAIAAVTLVAFNPTLIAQSRYVSTDVAAALATTIAVGELVRYLTGRSGRRGVYTLAAAIAAAVLTKHSGLLLLPIFFLIGGLFVSLRRGRFADQPRKASVKTFAAHAGITALVLLLATNVVYKFDRTFLTVDEILKVPEPKHWVYSPYKQRLLEEVSLLRHLPGGLPIPIPAMHIIGVAGVRAMDRNGFPDTYFWGEPNRHGHFLYFPTLLVIKNPPALLLLLLLAAAIAVRKRLRISPAMAIILGVSALFLVIAMRSQLNMGVRHVLPILPLLSIVAANAFTHAWNWARDREAVRLALASVVASTPVSAILTGPLYLGYFNFLVGSTMGHEISIFGEDWGQDRAALAKYVHRHQLSPLWYDFQTATRQLELDHFGVVSTPLRCRSEVPPGSWVAIHALTTKRLKRRNCFAWKRGRVPIARINDHIYIYWIPPDESATPTPAPTPPPAAEPDEPSVDEAGEP